MFYEYRGRTPSARLLPWLAVIPYKDAFVNGFSVPGTRSSFQPDTSPAVQRLMDWLDEDDGVGATTIGVSNNGIRGLYATEAYEPGEYILAIPSSSCLVLYDRIYDMLESEPDIEREARDVTKGAQRLHQLMHQKEINDWTSIYLDTLPTDSSNFDASPDFWDEKIIRQLEFHQLVQDMLERREEQLSDGLAFAKWLVRSRAFTTFQMLSTSDETTSRTLRTRTMLIPYIDMLNHAANSNTMMEKAETPSDEDTSYFSLMATRSIYPGDELTLTYGSGYETCLDFVTKYGFWLPDNPNDMSLELSNVEWSTSLKKDEEALHQTDSSKESQQFRDMLKLRIHLKRIQQQQREKIEYSRGKIDA